MQINTHAKYLVRNKQDYVTLGSDGLFSARDTIWERFDGPATLKEMKEAAKLHAGLEKTGVYHLVRRASNVIDLELALWGRPTNSKKGTAAAKDETDTDARSTTQTAGTTDEKAPAESDTGREQQRLDVVSIEAFDGGARLAFHEAKHFVHKHLRADEGPPPVIEQIKKYEIALRSHEAALIDSYKRVCGSLVAIEEMRAALRNRPAKQQPKRSSKAIAAWDLVHGVATGKIPLTLAPLPRLVVFGYDEDQRKGPVWSQHIDKLRRELPARPGARRTYFVGKPENSKVAFELCEIR